MIDLSTEPARRDAIARIQRESFRLPDGRRVVPAVVVSGVLRVRANWRQAAQRRGAVDSIRVRVRRSQLAPQGYLVVWRLDQVARLIRITGETDRRHEDLDEADARMLDQICDRIARDLSSGRIGFAGDQVVFAGRGAA